MLQVNTFDLIKGFSGVIDMLNTTLASHHHRTAVIVDQVCTRLGLPSEQHNLAVMAAMLHDIGVIPLHDHTDNLVFEKDMARHSQAGHLLLRTCPVLAAESEVVRHHHTDWKVVQQLPENQRELATLGNLIHLADTIDVRSRVNPAIESICQVVAKGRGTVFGPESAEAALDFLNQPDFSDLLESPGQSLYLPPAPGLILTGNDVVVFSMLFSHIIDSRSHFTATHTTGVAHIGRILHELAGLPEEDSQTMFVAGLLHDIGKMGVPNNLIEKPGPLSDEEFRQVSRHADLSKEVLSSIPGFEKVAPWGARHHEKLNGRGYPDGLKGDELCTESRLMAVADVMTALTEDRPYRAGLEAGRTMSILSNMVKQNALDGDIVELLRKNYDYVNHIRRETQTEAGCFFKNLANDITLKCPPPKH